MFQFTKEKINKDFFLSSKFIKGAISTFVLAVLLYGFLSFYSGKENVFKAFSSFPKSYLFLILILVSFGWFLRGLRWHYYLRKTNIKNISFFKSLHLFLASFSLTVTPGKAGELVKSIFLKKENNVPISKTAGIFC